MKAGKEKRVRGGNGSPNRRCAVHIAEVAALAGVSTATVSRTLSMPGRVRTETRERVLEVVRQTGYTPNMAGRSLRAARSMTVLVVVPTVITPFFNDLLLGIDRSLSEHGYQLVVGNLQDGQGREARLVELVLSGQVDGVLLLNGRLLRGPVRSLADAAVPIVAVSVPTERPDLPAVLVDERQGAIAAAHHLLDLGHRRFGYISGPLGHAIDQERWAGFRATLVEAGIDEASIMCMPGDFHVHSGVEAGALFLKSAARPTAVFAASDMMAIGFMRKVRSAGLDVPRDVSIVGFDGIEFADYCEPPLTTVRQPREAMGRKAADLLIRLIAGEDIPAAERRLRLEVVFRPAGSTGPVPVRPPQRHSGSS
jgi:LacI family transcriptional regulator, repressor for deo operon, udp, cdd, tsx, nupC, and nupG